ncbi:glycosyltransferase, group 1 family protein [Porphyromonas uenonis 60-3]|uniref:Glycosyltransferase, group 1 family protein n=1 Tax=Porphyromonas uenonis 60-3 TaxID=596327 RepID=C2MAE4_9PORP|nr:glycosyltransferase [Porphyromonas uenonis]EEK17324.1 glycosyltransferase, group 1 family protein [Porphyromonas uenonis 60-3]
MQHTPRILIIHRALAPYRIDLFSHLTKRYDTELYLEYGQPLEQDFNLSLQGGRIQFDYKLLAPGSRLLPNLRPELLRILRKPYDLILCSEFNLLTGMLYLLRGLSARPLPRLVSMCDDNLIMAEETLRGSSFSPKRWMLDRIDGVILCNEQAKDLYRDRYRGELSKWHYLPIVQDEQYLQRQVALAQAETAALRSRYAIPDGRAVILYVGRLDKVKNLPRLLEAFRIVIDEDLDLQLLMVGDGPLDAELRQQATTLSLEERVTFAGKQQGSDLYAHYGLGDALILPSTYEPFGATVAEALVLGIPVAVSEVAGSCTLIRSEREGYRLNPLDKEDIARALRHLYRLIGERRDGATRHSLLPYTFDQYMSQLDGYLDSLIAERYK